MINNETPLAPFIDSAYYNEVYKPNKNARIEGSFNNVAEHKANFDAFRNRASEIVNRLVSNKITVIGGIEFAGQLAQATLKKATAAFIEHWYIKGYIMSDLDSTLNIGSMSARQLVKAESFRNITPFSALTNVQNSGMWDNKIIGVDLTKELADMGISAAEIVTWGDALAVFEQKGMGLNFHIEGDLTPVITGIAGLKKYIKIASTAKERISMEIMGGSDSFTKNMLEVVHDKGTLDKAEAFVWSQDVVADTPNFYTKYEDEKMSIYMEVADDLDDKLLAITNVYPDQTGEYGVLGSLDNSADLELMSKLSVIGNVSKLDLEVPTAELNLILPLFGLSPVGETTIPVTEYSLILTEMFSFLKDYKLQIIQPDGTRVETGLQDSIQSLSDAIGSYSNDDPNGELDEQLSLIRNIVINAENIKAALARISANEVRLTNNETQIATNKADIATLVADIKALSDRVATVESNLAVVAKTWEGDIQLQDPSINIAGLIASDGLPFNLNQGDVLSVSIKHSQDNRGQTQPVKIGAATPKVFVIPTGTQSDAIEIQIAPDGSLTANITNGNDNIPEFALFELVQERATAPVDYAYTKAQSDATYYTKAAATAERARIDAELAKKANTTEVQTKIEAAAETVRVDNALTKKTELTTFNTEVIRLDKKADNAQATADGAQTIAGLAKVAADAAQKTADEAAVQTEVDADLLKKASTTLNNVNVGTENAGKTLAVTATGAIEFKDEEGITASTIQIFKGQVLSFAERKTTGAFADRTLFSETAIPKGYAILGGTGETTTKGSIPATTATQAAHRHSLNLDGGTGGKLGGSGSKADQGTNFPTGETKSATPWITIHQTVAHNTNGEVLGAGIEIVAYAYTALKDITFTEMGK